MPDRPPTAGPERPTVIYDGTCRFCQRQVERMKRRDPDGRFDYVPRQTPGLDDRFPQIRSGDFDTGMRLVHRDGRVSVGADAVYHTARALRGWRRLAWLYRVPGLRSILRWAYAWIARNRYRLAGRACDDTCTIGAPPPSTPGDAT